MIVYVDRPSLDEIQWKAFRPRPRQPRCPVCGEECSDFYRGHRGEIVGCKYCVDMIDAYDYEEEKT